MFDPFLVVVDLMGEGRVDLNVRFTFSLLFQVFHRLLFLGSGMNLWRRIRHLLWVEREKSLLVLSVESKIGRLYSRAHPIECVRRMRTVSFPCMMWFLKTWVSNFLSPIFKEKCSAGPNCLLLRSIPILAFL